MTLPGVSSGSVFARISESCHIAGHSANSDRPSEQRELSITLSEILTQIADFSP